MKRATYGLIDTYLGRNSHLSFGGIYLYVPICASVGIWCTGTVRYYIFLDEFWYNLITLFFSRAFTQSGQLKTHQVRNGTAGQGFFILRLVKIVTCKNFFGPEQNGP